MNVVMSHLQHFESDWLEPIRNENMSKHSATMFPVMLTYLVNGPNEATEANK